MRTPFLFFSSLSSLSLLLISIRGATAQNLIENTCKICSQQDPNVAYGFCTTSLQAAPASRCATLRGHGMLSIWLTQNNVTDTRCYIKHLLKKELNPYVRACLKDCFELYSDAISSLKQAKKNYNSKCYLDANIQISSVMDAATTCEDGFGEQEGIVSPLTERNNATFELSALVLSIMHMLQTGSN